MNPLQPLFRTMARWSVATQLYAGFGAVLCLMALLGALSMWALHRVDRQAESLAEKWMHSVGHLSEMRMALQEARDFEVKHSRTSDRSYHAEYEDKIAVAQKKVAQELEGYLELLVAPEEREKGDKLRKTWAGYQKLVRRSWPWGATRSSRTRPTSVTAQPRWPLTRLWAC
jgi:CHASE3 domain sensor protein